MNMQDPGFKEGVRVIIRQVSVFNKDGLELAEIHYSIADKDDKVIVDPRSGKKHSVPVVYESGIATLRADADEVVRDMVTAISTATEKFMADRFDVEPLQGLIFRPEQNAFFKFLESLNPVVKSNQLSLFTNEEVEEEEVLPEVSLPEGE